jgi:hypothetical protein
MLTGLALMVLPFALGLSTAGMLAGALVGALVVGLALQTVDVGRGTSVSAHHAADLGVAVGLGAAAVVFGAAGDVAGLLFGGAALVQLALNLTTRYTLR